ncbi:MAG: AI-2E family transporter [Nanoarchaeota archaeon]|nr:AI-2E family transporter [Nanoarchaeota archaeon]
MITEKNFKDVLVIVLIIGLFILAAMVLKPLIFSIIWGALLAYIFYPFYKWTFKLLKNESLSAFLICFLLFLIILIPIVLVINYLIGQAISFYLTLQTLDLASIIKQALHLETFSSPILEKLATSLNSQVPKILSDFIIKFGNMVLNIPVILLKLFVVIFVFFFVLRDGEKAMKYVGSLFPFKKEVEEKFIMQFKGVTNSVLLGQVVVGVIQGAVAGIGYFVFGVPYAPLLTVLTMFVAIIPFIGAWLGWVPAVIYLFSVGRAGAGLGLLIYGILIVSLIDNVIRTVVVARRTKINSAVVIIGMIGGMFVFGVVGLVLGPLILSYVILIIELYRLKKSGESIFFKQAEENT